MSKKLGLHIQSFISVRIINQLNVIIILYVILSNAGFRCYCFDLHRIKERQKRNVYMVKLFLLDGTDLKMITNSISIYRLVPYDYISKSLYNSNMINPR